MMPNYYKATAVVLPARKQGGALDNITSGLSNSLKDIGLAKLSGGEESYTPLSLLASRELQGKLVQQFGFQKYYNARTLDEAIDIFSANLDCEISLEGNF